GATVMSIASALNSSMSYTKLCVAGLGCLVAMPTLPNSLRSSFRMRAFTCAWFLVAPLPTVRLVAMSVSRWWMPLAVVRGGWSGRLPCGRSGGQAGAAQYDIGGDPGLRQAGGSRGGHATTRL